MNGVPQKDRKHILGDPVAAYRQRHPQPADDFADQLLKLAGEYRETEQQHHDLQEKSGKISRKIGNAKRNGESFDDLLAEMRVLGEDLKVARKKQQQLESEILTYFTVEQKPAQKVASVEKPRYKSGNAPAPEIDVTLLGDETGLWNSYVDNHPAASIYHRAEWRDVISKSFGHDCRYYIAHDNNNQSAGVLPLVHLQSRLFGNFMISMPYFNYGGALAGHPQTEQSLMDTANSDARRDGISHIEYRDTFPRKGLPVRSRKVCMLLELPAEHETLWNGFPSKLRAQIRRPLREQPEISCSGRENLDDFYTVFSRNMRDLGTPVYSKAFFDNILQTFPENSSIICIRLNNRPVAAGFLLGYRKRLEIPWASTIREVNHLGMNMLLYWEVLKYAIAGKYREFDFGRSSRDSGTYRFKQQWGASPAALYWHYWQKNTADVPELNPDNPKYALAIGVWKRLPLSITNRLGPHLVKYLP